MGWYYYLEDHLHVPFAATCRLERTTSPLKVGEKVKVLGMAPEDDCMSARLWPFPRCNGEADRLVD
jgi:hypothetical protein